MAEKKNYKKAPDTALAYLNNTFVFQFRSNIATRTQFLQKFSKNTDRCHPSKKGVGSMEKWRTIKMFHSITEEMRKRQ